MNYPIGNFEPKNHKVAEICAREARFYLERANLSAWKGDVRGRAAFRYTAKALIERYRDLRAPQPLPLP